MNRNSRLVQSGRECDWRCGPAAGFWQRSGAFLIDLALLSALHLASCFTMALVLLLTIPLDLQSLLSATMIYALLILVSPLLLGLTYFTVLHAWGGQTMGKLILGIRVTRPGADSCTTGQAFLRATGYLVSALPLGVGFWWAALDHESRSWHDRLAETTVVEYL